MYITYESLYEYIELLDEKHNDKKEFIDVLFIIRNDAKEENDNETVNELNYYIRKYCERYSICPNCGNELQSNYTKEIHDELDCNVAELVFTNMHCDNCGYRE